jgi:hypothetical protein
MTKTSGELSEKLSRESVEIVQRMGCVRREMLLDADHSNGEAIAEIINRDLAAGPDVLLVLGTS